MKHFSVLLICYLLLTTKVQATDLINVHAYLSGIAAKNGMVSTTSHSVGHSGINGVLSVGQPNTIGVLSVGQPNTIGVNTLLQSIHNLPHVMSLPLVIADPTPGELNFILPGATDSAGLMLPEPIPGLLFGHILPVSVDIYNIAHFKHFDDLSDAIIPNPLLDDGCPNPAYVQFELDMQAQSDAVDVQNLIDAQVQEAENNRPLVPGVDFDIVVDTDYIEPTP